MHGPNLNLLGTREPEIYGADTLESINLKLIGQAEQQGHQLSTKQSNAEHGASLRRSTTAFLFLEKNDVAPFSGRRVCACLVHVVEKL